MAQRVTFPAAGREAGGVLFTPEDPARRPAVIVVHEWWGVNAQIQSVAQAWANEGFVALVPDLFHGKLAASAAEAGAMMKQLDVPDAVNEIAGALAYLQAHPRCTGKVALTGYCMGGGLTLQAACSVRGLAAAVPFYGLPSSAEWAAVEAPIMAHFATEDTWATVEGAKKVQTALAAHGRTMELHVYKAKHAFCNDMRPEVYDAAAAALAWQRTVQFVRDHSA